MFLPPTPAQLSQALALLHLLEAHLPQTTLCIFTTPQPDGTVWISVAACGYAPTAEVAEILEPAP
jgi:hypothetical protein